MNAPSLASRIVYTGLAGFFLFFCLTEMLYANEKIIPCTLKKEVKYAEMQCEAIPTDYCKGREHPKCEVSTSYDICVGETRDPVTNEIICPGGHSTGCDTTTHYKPDSTSPEKTLYSYKLVTTVHINSDSPGAGYIPVYANKPLRWSTSRRERPEYFLKKPDIFNPNAPYPGCTGGDAACGGSRSIPGCIVQGGENAKACTVSVAKRHLTLPGDQNMGSLLYENNINDDHYTYGPISPLGVISGPAPLPEAVERQAEGVYGLADDGAPTIEIQGVNLSKLFVQNTTTWCNIDTYSKHAQNNYTPSPGCQEYVSGANVSYGEDLFKNIRIIFKDTSGISSASIQLGKCSFETIHPGHSCRNGSDATIKTKIITSNELKDLFGISRTARIDTSCLVPGKNALLITAADDARSALDGILSSPESSVLSVPGYIHIDNAPAKLLLSGDFAPALFNNIGNSFTGCFLNNTGAINGLKNTNQWVNYSIFGNLKVADPYAASMDNCFACYFTGNPKQCQSSTYGKPTGANHQSIWTGPLGVDPRTGRYASVECGGIAVPIDTTTPCAWGCETGYTRYAKSRSVEACGLAAVCGKSSRTESSTTPAGGELCLQGTLSSPGVIRTGSGWSWQCSSRDTGGILINTVDCASYFPGQAECGTIDCMDATRAPACTISFNERFGNKDTITPTTPKQIGDGVTLSWNSKNMDTIQYSCSGVQVPGNTGKWEGTMQAGAGEIPLVTIRDNISCIFSTSGGQPVCSYANNKIKLPSDRGVCGELSAGSLFQDIPPAANGLPSPSSYCQLGSVVDFTNLAHMSSGTVSFTDEFMSGAAHTAYKTLTEGGNQLINGPFIWGCKKDVVQPCTAGSCMNGMTYNPYTGLCDGACAEGTITIIGEDGQKQCVSCDQYEGYEPYMNEYAPGKFACYYYSSELKFPYMGISNDPNGSGSYWHGTGNLWKDYTTLMKTLRSFERPKDLIEGPDIQENLSGSVWTQAKYANKHQFIVGTGAAVGRGTTGFAIENVEKSQDITFRGNTFPKPCFNSQDRTVDPSDVWIIENRNKTSGCQRTQDPLGSDILSSSNLDTYLSIRPDNDCDLGDTYTGAYLGAAYSTFTLSSIAQPNATGHRITYTYLEEVVSFNDVGTTSKKGDIRKITLTYRVFDAITGSEIATSEDVKFTRNCSALGGGCKTGGEKNHSRSFINTYIDIGPYDDTCWEEKEDVDFTVQLASWCGVSGKTLSNCYKVTGYDEYGQEIRQPLPMHEGIDINNSKGPLMYTAIYPYYWSEFADTNIPTQFMDGMYPFLYKNSNACWLVFENTYRREYIGMIHFKERFAHDNLIHPYVYISANNEGSHIGGSSPGVFRKTMNDHPDGVTMGLAENGTCSTIASGAGGFAAPTRKKPKIRITNPDRGSGGNPDVRMCTVFDESVWDYVPRPCP